MLSIMVDGNPGQWDDMLPFVILAYNNSVHKSTGVTSAIAMLSRELRFPLYATGLHPGDLRAYQPCGRASEGPPEDAATSPKVPVRPTHQGVTFLPERPRVACDATKREAQPWMRGAVPGGGDNGARDVSRTAP
ncbi:hypothetical protein T06_10071 [Trichinella sp. T6]|nr:hypothetical protein T06_10071 [Trichinella sp. T6]